MKTTDKATARPIKIRKYAVLERSDGKSYFIETPLKYWKDQLELVMSGKSIYWPLPIGHILFKENLIKKAEG